MGKKKKRKTQHISVTEITNEQSIDDFMKQQTSFKSKRGQQRKEEKDIEDAEDVQKSKKKRRRRKKKDAAKQAKSGKQLQKSNVPTGPIRSECKACKQWFGSKSKLFDHLKQFPQHALVSRHQ